MKPISFILGVLVIAALLSACGPTAEEIATQTAAAWTSTPTPTLTPSPTPIPYDLTVLVTDIEGAPLSSVTVTLNELGNADSATQSTDDAGKVSWMNLPGESVSYTVALQGYFPGEGSETIERGMNEVTLALERDPYGLLSADACAAGEKLLYIEDFQDERAQDWPEVEFNAPGWTLGTLPEQEGNYGLSASAPGVFSRLEGGYVFDNAVWRLKFMVQGYLQMAFNWRFANEPYTLNDQVVEDSRYQIISGTDGSSHMRLLIGPVNVSIANPHRFPKQNTWHTIEISTFENLTQAWLDGKLYLERTQQDIQTPGTIGLEVWVETEDKFVHFDDLSVCELSAPFETMFTTE